MDSLVGQAVDWAKAISPGQVLGVLKVVYQQFQELKDLGKDREELQGLISTVLKMMQQPHVIAKMQENSTIITHVLEEIARTAKVMSELLQRIAAKNVVWKFICAADYRSDLQRHATALNRQATMLMADLGLSADSHIKQLKDHAHLQLTVLKSLAEQGNAMREQLGQLGDSVQIGNAQVARMAALLEQVLAQPGLDRQDVAGLVQDLQQEKQRMAALKNQAEAAYLEQIIQLISLSEQQGSHASTSSGAGPSQPAPPPVAPPHEYLCPIMQELMADPVIVAESAHTYERSAIEQWLSKNNTDPATRAVLKSKLLVPNLALRNAIKDWCTRHSVCLGASASAANAGSNWGCALPSGHADRHNSAPPPVPFWGPLPAMRAPHASTPGAPYLPAISPMYDFPGPELSAASAPPLTTPWLGVTGITSGLAATSISSSGAAPLQAGQHPSVSSSRPLPPPPPQQQQQQQTPSRLTSVPAVHTSSKVDANAAEALRVSSPLSKWKYNGVMGYYCCHVLHCEMVWPRSTQSAVLGHIRLAFDARGGKDLRDPRTSSLCIVKSNPNSYKTTPDILAHALPSQILLYDAQDGHCKGVLQWDKQTVVNLMSKHCQSAGGAVASGLTNHKEEEYALIFTYACNPKGVLNDYSPVKLLTWQGRCGLPSLCDAWRNAMHLVERDAFMHGLAAEGNATEHARWASILPEALAQPRWWKVQQTRNRPPNWESVAQLQSTDSVVHLLQNTDCSVQ